MHDKIFQRHNARSANYSVSHLLQIQRLVVGQKNADPKLNHTVRRLTELTVHLGDF